MRQLIVNAALIRIAEVHQTQLFNKNKLSYIYTQDFDDIGTCI